MKKKTMNLGRPDYEAPSARIQARIFSGFLCTSGDPEPVEVSVDAGEFDENEW